MFSIRRLNMFPVEASRCQLTLAYFTVTFLVTEPSFLAGAAATLGFFAVFKVLIKLFFCMAGSSGFEFGTAALLAHAGTVPNPAFKECGTITTEN